MEAVDLMAAAARAAADDAGAPGLLAHVDTVMVPTGTWRYADAGRLVAQRIGAERARTVRSELGVLQTTLLRRACEAIADGRADVVLVVGGEAKYRDLEAKRSGTPAPNTEDTGAEPDEVLRPHSLIVNHAEISAGLISAVAQYALIEQARRIAEGRSVEDHRRQVAELWAMGNVVARTTPDAWNPAPMDADAIATAGPDNRPLALPYLKWHNSQWNVDQAAAIIVCSAVEAERHGVERTRWVYPRVIVDSDHAVPLTERAELHRCPGFEVAARIALEHCAIGVGDLGPVDLYSCFPIAVATQQREIGLEPADPWTITGGMAFGGGPFNNYVLQSTASMIARLRAEPHHAALVTAVSGLLTKQGVTIWSSTEPSEPFGAYEVGAEVADATATVEVSDGPGPATIASWTVGFEGDPKVFVVADRPDGTRGVAWSTDPTTVEIAAARELAGAPIELHPDRTFTLGGTP